MTEEIDSEMDETYLAIIHWLAKNARITISKMSQEIDVLDTTISAQGLERAVIKGCTAVLNPQTLGLKMTAIITKQAETERLGAVKIALSKLQEVSGVHSVSGQYDLLIKLSANDMEELNHVINNKIRSIDRVDDLTEMIVMERLKEEIVPQIE